jgi:hypothetical protein
MPHASLLLSHLPTQIRGDELPFRTLIQAVEFLQSRGLSAVTSAGQSHWNCILSVLIRHNIPTHIILPKQIPLSYLDEQFPIANNPNNVITTVIVSSREQRDRDICEQSDCIIPVWLREKGHLASYVTNVSGTKIETRFNCSEYNFETPVKYEVPEPSNEIRLLPSGYIWHWTRAAIGAWSGETEYQYWCDRLFTNNLPHNALMTLIRIIREQRLRASGKHITGNEPVVAFTENHPSSPATTETMLRWRQRRHRMNFEPYSIGIPQQDAIARSTKPIKYGGERAWDTMQTGKTWQQEKEWRHQGDFILDDECLKNAIVIVRAKNEIEMVKQFFGGKVYAFGK